MYCEKLNCILDNPKSSRFLIDSLTIYKLDSFLKEKVSLVERKRLNPSKFANLMNVEQKTALMTFVLGVECNLFKTLAYYDCDCGEGRFIFSMDPFECDCGKIINPQENRDKIFLYFELLLPLEYCSHENVGLYPIDFIQENSMDFTLAGVDEIVGEESADSMLSLKDRRTQEIKRRLES
ncbi:hypothetical protein [Exiguobacterium sp. s162]|uniref:hypothetical protein n=1 Tax=Exiguobacterium sp. s162 TaxID=2751276 RepID=UPI001BE5BCFF|nr:hypothetical protein [Exiguobacterium sp. s162]